MLNDQIETGVMIAIDVATIYTGAGAIAQINKLQEISRLYKGIKYSVKAFEVANAVGNISLHLLKDELSDTKYRELVEASNVVMAGWIEGTGGSRRKKYTCCYKSLKKYNQPANKSCI